MAHLLEIFIASITSHNIALTYILGMCPLIAISKKVKTAFGMGISVVFVVTLTVFINWPIYNKILLTTDSDNIALLVFIIIIAATVQFLEMFLEKFAPSLYNAFGIYLPLITVNCVVLSVSLFMVTRQYTYSETVVFGFGSALGWTLAIVTVAAIREKLALTADIPKGLQGVGIVLIITGLLALGFTGFGGMANIQ